MLQQADPDQPIRGIYKLSCVDVSYSRASVSFPIDGLIPFNANPIQPQLPKPYVPLADVLRQLVYIYRGESLPIVAQRLPPCPHPIL